MRGKVIRICSRAVPAALATMAALLVAVPLAACGSEDPTPTPTPRPAVATATPTPVPGLLDQLYAGAQEEGEVVWATTDQEEVTALFIEAFQETYPGVKVSLIRATSAELRDRLFLEATADKITVDVTDPGRDNRVVEEDIAEDLTDIIEELGVDPNLVYSDNRIFLKVGVPHAPMCNTNRLSESEFPTSYQDLLDPRFNGEIVVENRLKGFIYLTNIPEYGDTRPDLWAEDDVAAYLSAVKANDLRALRGNTGVGDLVASGEVLCALEINVSSFERLWLAGAPVALVPVKVFSVEPVYHFVPKGAPHPNAAKLFSAFLLSERGQELWAEARPTSDLSLTQDTPYANYARELGSKIVPSGTELNDHFGRLTDRYVEAIGIPTG